MQKQPTSKEIANQKLGIIKSALDIAVKSGAFENMDMAYAVSQSFNDIVLIVTNSFENVDKNENEG